MFKGMAIGDKARPPQMVIGGKEQRIVMPVGGKMTPR